MPTTHQRLRGVCFAALSAGTVACGAADSTAPSEPLADAVTDPLGTNLLANASFESGTNGDATSWTERTPFSRNDAGGHAGSWSLRAAALFGGASASSSTIAAKPNTVYRLSGWLYRTNGWGNAYLDLNDVAGEPNTGTAVAGSWQYVSGTWNSGTRTSVTVRCVVENVNANVWFDDLGFAEEPTTPPPPPPPPPPPSSTRGYGYSAHVLWQGDQEAYVKLATDGGASTIRDDFSWAAIEPSRLVWQWAETDRLVTLASRGGLSVLAMAGYGAAWSTGCSTTKCGPLNNADYAEFVRQIALRYGHDGTFWEANPSVPNRPLAGIEIWNEPNLDLFWSGPNAARYTATLKAAYTAIKSADPRMVVVSGGLSPFATYPTTNSPLKFLETMYQNGAHGFMDAVGYHPYYFFQGAIAAQMVAGGSWAEMYLTTPSARSLMSANGDSAKTIWATELGAPTFSGGVTEAEQGNLATRQVALWKTFPWAGNYYWYDLRDDGASATDREHHFGATRRDNSAKPAYANLKAAWTTP